MHYIQKLSSRWQFSALVNNVFLGICPTKLEARLLTKRHPFLGMKRGSGPLTHLSGSFGFSEKGFQVPVLVLLRSLGRWDWVSYYVLIGSWHGMLCCQKQDSAVLHVLRTGSLVGLRGALCFLSEATSGCVAPQGSLSLQWWTITPYFCLIR